MEDHRFLHLQELMKRNDLKVIALNPGSTLTYLTGLSFHLMERPTVLLVHLGFPPVLVLPELEVGKIEQSRISLLASTYRDDPASWQAAFHRAVEKLDITSERIGVEANHFRVLESDFLQKAAPKTSISAADEVFTNFRIQKDAEEILLMRRAVQIAQKAFLNTLPFIRAGISEKEIAAELTIQMLRQGADAEMPFPPIIASGPNSANPHAVPSDRVLSNGDLVVIDWGAKYNGYCSDLTRTLVIGQPSDQSRAIFTAVQDANAAGRAVGKPGVPAGIVDDAARKIITKRGFGEFFTHRTGHGLGMEEHETPYIFSSNQLVLQPGMVYTVEPGIYLPGVGGVRIEDDVVITASGAESLSDLSRDILII